MSLRDLIRLGRSSAIAAAALLLLALGMATTQMSGVLTASAQTPPLTVSPTIPLRLSLEGRLEGPAAIVLVPQDKGYYRQEGLDITVDEGASAVEPITRVASGSHEIGVADINALIKYRDQHPTAPIKAIFMVYNRPPFAIVARKSRGITEPKQLEGKKLGAPITGSTFGEWPLFAKLNDIDASKVIVEQVGIPVRAPMLAAGQLDAALGYSFRIYVDLKDRGVPVDDIVLMQMADYGLKLYGSAIVVNSKFATEKPEAVKGFLRAFTKGLRETVRNPAAAVDSVLKREDAIRKEVELERLRMAIRDNIITPEVRANGFGAVDPARLEDSITQIGLTYTYKAKPKPDDVFDPTFLPSATDRRVN
jgi:NitT/TauT family transport system substrate-binding protein